MKVKKSFDLDTGVMDFIPAENGLVSNLIS